MAKQVPPLNMSGVLALQALLKYTNHHTLDFLKKNDPSYLRFDWLQADRWKNIVSDNLNPDDLGSICRSVCLEFVRSQPILLELARNGRASLIANLVSDEQQVFRNGNLLDKQPTKEVLDWWDYLRLLAKSDLDARLLAQGRMAELWTMDEEKKIVGKFTNQLPELVSLESDRFGYDILSYRLESSGKIQKIQIEVKSYSASNYPYFFLTINEWKKASQIASTYLLYLWNIEKKECTILTYEEINKNIPHNIGRGEWQNVLIEFT